tara:strand:+ start:5283 stop:5519 length:237 start_codon:yes stop_codon:yes gene_type:complete
MDEMRAQLRTMYPSKVSAMQEIEKYTAERGLAQLVAILEDPQKIQDDLDSSASLSVFSLRHVHNVKLREFVSICAGTR